MRPSLERSKLEAQGYIPHTPRVILAEDDEELRRLLASTLRRDGYEVLEASNGFELLELLADQLLHLGSMDCCKLVIADIRMPGANGLQALEALRGWDWATPLMVITAFGDEKALAQSRRLGVDAMFDKPFDLDDFRTAVYYLVPSAR